MNITLQRCSGMKKETVAAFVCAGIGIAMLVLGVTSCDPVPNSMPSPSAVPVAVVGAAVSAALR